MSVSSSEIYLLLYYRNIHYFTIFTTGTLLPNTILTSLVESNAEQFNKLYSLQDNILTALNELNTSINKLNDIYNINNQNNKMNKRFDTLFNLISKINTVLERQS